MDEDKVTGVTDEDRIVMAVEEYAQAGRGLKYSPTIQARRVIKALQLIGLDRSDFWARTHVDRRTGEYLQAHGTAHNRTGCAIIIKNAALLRRCGLNVHVLNTDTGRENAFVSTPLTGPAQVIRHASVSSRT